MQASSGISTAEKSTFVSSFIKTWPNATVYYTLPSQGNLSTQNYNKFLTNINKAFDMISSQTSMQFVERTHQAEYITFTYKKQQLTTWMAKKQSKRHYNL